MAVFRIERTRDYTVMSNHHLKDTALSLKAKGLLSMMLSLPDEWNYTTRGLAAICKEGVDASAGRCVSWKRRATSSAASFAVLEDALATRSTPSTKSPAPVRRNRQRNQDQIRPRQIRAHQIRLSRIWWNRIWWSHLRKSPQN